MSINGFCRKRHISFRTGSHQVLGARGKKRSFEVRFPQWDGSKADFKTVLALILARHGYECRYKSENVSPYVPPLKIFVEIDFLHAFRETSKRMLGQALERDVFEGKLKLKVLRPEDIIGLKVQTLANNPDRYSREIADIEALMERHGRGLDWRSLEEYFALFDYMEKFLELKEKYGIKPSRKKNLRIWRGLKVSGKIWKSSPAGAMTRLIPVFCLLFPVFYPLSSSFAEEQITITTYYPAPYGVYREMRAQRMAVGDNYINTGTYAWGSSIDTNADLVVEGNVGIGTASPASRLEVKPGTNSRLIVSNACPGGWCFTNPFSSPEEIGIFSRNDANSDVSMNFQASEFTFLGGYLGIGTASPQATLDVNGTTRVKGTGGYSYDLIITPITSYGPWQNGWYCCGIGWADNTELGVNGGTDTCDGNIYAQYTCTGAPKKCNDTWDWWTGSCPSCGAGPNGAYRTVDCGATASITAKYSP